MMAFTRSLVLSVLAALLLACLAGFASAERLKDISGIAGIRSNPIVGYGLVVGLGGTGDSAPFTNQTFRNMMNRFGVTIPPNVNPNLKNVAAVTLHADLPAFAKPGQRIDITVSSIGNSKSLRGGSLLLANMRGADGEIYATAQGNLIVGGFGIEGADGSSVTVNQPSVGRIPNGASVERAVPTAFAQGDSIIIQLNSPDFTTAKRVQEAINAMLGDDVAAAIDANSIRVQAPRDAAQRVSYLSILENLQVDPGVGTARIVINSRTGTIVVGQNVKVLPAAVTHGNLSVTISESLGISQPGPFSDGQTVVVPQTEIEVEQEAARMFQFGPATTLAEIVRAVNQVGAAPGDVMAILEALQQAGALRAELIVI